MKLGKIPNNRAVTGYDVIRLQEYFGLSLMEMTYLLGNYGVRFQAMVDVEKQHEPVSNVSRALLIRTIYEMVHEGRNFVAVAEVFPWALPFAKAPSISKFYAEFTREEEKIIRDYPELNRASFSVVLGMRANGMARWEESDTKPRPVVHRLMTLLYSDMKTRGYPAVQKHMELCRLEARGRGHGDLGELLKRGLWNLETARNKKRKGRRNSDEDE